VWPLLGSHYTGLGVYLAGHSPYRQLHWFWDTDLYPKISRSSSSLQVLSTRFDPFHVAASISTQEGLLLPYLASVRQPRYQTAQIKMIRTFYRHHFSFDHVWSRTYASDTTLSGLILTHSWEQKSRSLFGAGARRGLQLNEAIAFFPRSLGSFENISLFRADQVVSLPWGLDSHHGFQIETTEVHAKREAGENLAIAGGYSNPADARLSTHAWVALPGFAGEPKDANSIFKSMLSYRIPIPGMDASAMHIWDRTWFNVGTGFWEFGPFVHYSLVGQGEKSLKNLKPMSATGIQLSFGIYVFDLGPLILNAYVAKQLTGKKSVELSVLSSGQFTF
jgi:hypothetical protein